MNENNIEGFCNVLNTMHEIFMQKSNPFYHAVAGYFEKSRNLILQLRQENEALKTENMSLKTARSKGCFLSGDDIPGQLAALNAEKAKEGLPPL